MTIKAVVNEFNKHVNHFLVAKAKQFKLDGVESGQYTQNDPLSKDEGKFLEKIESILTSVNDEDIDAARGKVQRACQSFLKYLEDLLEAKDLFTVEFCQGILTELKVSTNHIEELSNSYNNLQLSEEKYLNDMKNFFMERGKGTYNNVADKKLITSVYNVKCQRYAVPSPNNVQSNGLGGCIKKSKSTLFQRKLEKSSSGLRVKTKSCYNFSKLV
jgi:hypothetical protein